MSKLIKRGSSYYMDLTVKGDRVRKCLGTNKVVAELALKDIEVKIARKQYDFDQKDVSLDSFLISYQKYSDTNHRSSTSIRYNTVIGNFLKFVSKRILVSDISPELIEKYKSHRNKTAKISTINLELTMLKTIFNKTVEWGYANTNPLKSVKKIKEIRSKNFRWLSKTECCDILSASSGVMRNIICTFLNTGMRKAELENLTWNDIDWTAKEIRIQAKANWQPKTGERNIPMTNGVLTTFTDMLNEAGDVKEFNASYVFPTMNLQYRFKELVDMLGLEDVKLHTLRHTFASHLVMNGASLPAVKELLGHADIQTTMIYAHLNQAHLAKSIEKLPNFEVKAIAIPIEYKEGFESNNPAEAWRTFGEAPHY